MTATATLQELTQSFDLVIDCCMAPTVITAPLLPQSSYLYRIGDPALVINLSADAWLGDNACC